MMKPLILMLSAGLMMGAVPAQAGGDVAAGKAKSATCAACHGKDGMATMPEYPNLAGQNAAYLEKSLEAYRDGSRGDPVMGPMARPLSDADIANLAAYYASLGG